MDNATRRLIGALISGAALGLSATPAAAEDLVAASGRVQVAMIDDVAFGRIALSDALPTRPAVDLGLLKKIIESYRAGNVAEGDKLRVGIDDPSARSLTEWVAIRSNASLGFERIANFLKHEASWPAGSLIRRRAEEALLQSRKPSAVVRAFFTARKPVSPAGKYALALALQADRLDGDAASLIRETWRKDQFGKELEAKILERFPDALTQADHRFRMERMLFKESWDAARRAAARAGKDYLTLVKARIAVSEESKKAPAALEAVPAALRLDSSYLFSRAQHLRHKKQPAEAAKVMAGAPRDPDVLGDGDEWWVERRLVARKLLDQGDHRTAYEVARNHAAEGTASRVEAEFHAGWIALRFLHEPGVAAGHFREAARIAETPISVARAAYWQARTAEAVGADDVARRHFERAASYPITYYGQLARAKLGTGLALRVPDAGETAREKFSELAASRGLRFLYAVGANDLAIALNSELGQRLSDAGQLDALGDLATEYRDARSLLVIGKAAVQRGFPLDLHAYPTIGVPSFEPIGGRVHKALVFAITRQESAFNPRAQSHAGARGLMQLMPATAKRTAKRFGLGFDVNKLIDDPAYNAKIGAAHLGELMEDWRGSLILTFASYNAGGGNVKKWIDAYGDPRKGQVDPVDWIERIPFSETRNYVQRVLENFQVYRHRLGERSALMTEGDLKRSAALQ